ncbi:MAG: hypothetical protein LBC53_08965 [Spirochaetaceae bacterium]|jgi:KaiC/GvpD/RAD55 family RecA-like ATPase|nr:hypothetical protein [Spirochaetaceae bacterium]
MVKNELIQRSPVRILEKAMHGSLKPGEMGVVAGPSGLGKTSVLVQIALDKLFQDKKVIHISFTPNADFVLDWYSIVFNELINKKNVENAGALKEQLAANRILMNFSQTGVDSDVIRKSLHSMIVEGGYKAETIIIDGFDFSTPSYERIKSFKDFIQERGISAWYSCAVTETARPGEKTIHPYIKDLEEIFDCIVDIDSKAGHLELSVVKSRKETENAGRPVKLDPKTLLLLDS